MSAARPCLFVALTLAYLVAAHLALLHHSAALAALAVAALVLLTVASIRGPHRIRWRMIAAAAAAAAVATGADSRGHRLDFRPHAASRPDAAGRAGGARLSRAGDTGG